jgi:catechol 2,3-dioxygenase-like lactoylglutathione lyase family enzyme
VATSGGPHGSAAKSHDCLVRRQGPVGCLLGGHSRPPGANAIWTLSGIALDNDVALDFYETKDEIASQHYAFLIDDQGFDAVFARIRARGLAYWADPGKSRTNEINHNDGGRGFYFADPDGHLLEVITRPYGSD